MDEQRFVAAARNSGNEKRKIRRLRTRGPTELGHVASGSATKDLWLGNRNVGSQVIGEDSSQLPGRTVGRVTRGRR